MSQTYYGQSYKNWTPRFSALDTLDTGVRGAKLTDLPGPISKVLGPAFNSLKSKMNVVYGLSVLHNMFGHQGTGASCSSSTLQKLNGVPLYYQLPASLQPSIQYILANSPKVYPDGDAGIARYIGVCRAYAGGGIDFDVPDFTFGPSPKAKHMGYVSNAKALYQKFAGSFNPNIAGSTDPLTQSRIKLVQDVYQDYKAVSASGQLSTADRPRFDAYMALIADVEKGLSTPLKSCSDPKPALAAEGGGGDPASLSDPTNGYTAGDRDCARILTAALACQLTSVVDFNIMPNGTPMHGYQHQGVDGPHSDYQAAYAKTFAYLWTLMDGLKDADGKTVLDNSLAIFTNGDGMCGLMPMRTPINDSGVGYDNWGAHAMSNMPIAIAGSAGGRLRTGYFLDYSLGSPKNAGYLDLNHKYFFDTGRPYNNFPVTIFSAFGLAPSDYETTPGQGYGEYDSYRCSLIPPELTAPAARRQPLPFLWKA